MTALFSSFLAPLVLAAAFTRPLERVTSLDPIRAQAVYDSRAVSLYCESPLEVDYLARPYRLKSGLCEIPEISADGLVYTLKMVDGSPVTARDVVRSLERLSDPELVSPGGWTMKYVEKMEAPDDRTVVITLKRRYHVFPWMLAMSYAGVRTESGEGTGPYRLKSWWKNHEMVYELNPAWRGWRDNAKPFDEIRYLVIDDVSTQWLMFLKGEIDFLGEISKDNWDAVLGADGKLDESLAAEGVELVSYSSLDVLYIGINSRDPVVGGNKKLRQALTSAFDFESWRKFNMNRVEYASGPIPVGVDGRLDEPSPYPFDLERAKKLLAEAGYPGGIDPATGRRLVLTLSIGRPTQDSREKGELIASFFEKIGVRLELQLDTWGAFLRAVNEGRVQLYFMGWVGDYPDAENFLQLFYSKNASPGPNHSNYSSPEFDAAFERGMDATTTEERNACWRECDRIVREDCPWIFTHYPKNHSLVRPRVGNYVPSAFPYGQERYLEVKDLSKSNEGKTK